MGIEHKHIYRFAYLKSDQWQSVRLEAIVRDNGECQLCGENIGSSADAHHIFYPKSFWNTKPMHLVTLCRSCHGYIHDHPPKATTFRQGLKTFQKLKAQFLRERKALEEASIPQKCWLCRKPHPNLSKFKSDHPKLINFYPEVCEPCRAIIEKAVKGAEHPFKVIKPLRAKKSVDVNSG